MNERRVAVVTDSTSDMLPALARVLGIHVVPLTVTLDGRDYLDGVDITPDEFYARVETSAAPATTSQPSPARFAELYRRLLEEHEGVLSIHISQKLSGTYASAAQAAGEVEPGRVRVLDSQLVSMPLALLVLAAAKLGGEGLAADAVIERLAPIQTAVRVYFMVATLDYLRRGGRIGRASQLLGSVLQVKPVLTLQEGQVTPLERIRTHDKALGRVIELAGATGRGGRLCAVVGHAASPRQAARVAASLEPSAESLVVAPLGPVVGAHAGPGTVGVGCYPADLMPLGLRDLSALEAPAAS